LSRFKILTTLDFSTCPEALDVFHGLADVTVLPWDYDAVFAVIGDYDAYLASTSVLVDAALVEKGKKLKVIGSPATGTDHLDTSAIDAAGITRFDIAKEFDLIRSFTATSELAFTLLLGLNRRLVEAVSATRNGDWARERYSGFQLQGKTFGVLGLGRLGTISARIAQGFGMNVIAFDVRDDALALGVERVAFDELFVRSDVVSVHVHLDYTTRGLVDDRALRLMKPSAILLNTARGAIVDELALLNALKEKRLAGAGVDVIEGEWLEDILVHPLVQYSRENENLLITPHIGGATFESINHARMFMAKKVADYLREIN